MRVPRPSASMAVSITALVVALSGTAYAATGGTFILGSPNDASSKTTLTANIADKTLSLNNSSTVTGAAALGLTVPAGKPPMRVSSTGKVDKLNADLLDGKDSTAFLPRAGKAADSDTLDGLDSSAFLPAATGIQVSATLGANADSARAAAPEHPLFAAGPLSVYAKCYTDAASQTTYAFAYIRTATNGAVFASGPEFDKKEGGAVATDFLNTDTPETDREIQRAIATSNSADYWRQKTTAFGAGGTHMSGMFAAGAKNGTLAGGNGAYGAGDSCIFTADVRSN